MGGTTLGLMCRTERVAAKVPFPAPPSLTGREEETVLDVEFLPADDENALVLPNK